MPTQAPTKRGPRPPYAPGIATDISSEPSITAMIMTRTGTADGSNSLVAQVVWFQDHQTANSSSADTGAEPGPRVRR